MKFLSDLDTAFLSKSMSFRAGPPRLGPQYEQLLELEMAAECLERNWEIGNIAILYC